MIIANIAAFGATVVVVYAFVRFAERKFNVNLDIARDLNGK